MQPGARLGDRRGVGLSRWAGIDPDGVPAWLRAVALLALLSWPAAASAQSLLQSLFGVGSPGPRPSATPYSYPLRSAPYFYAPHYGRSPWGSDPQSGSGEGRGSYRTVCVRLCDGFYWPLSHSVSRAQFTRDAKACQSSCGMDARLFYHSAGSGDVDTLVDLGGRAYTQIPNAFWYRKTLVAGCSCKPSPWSTAEVARHKRYAAIEAGGPTGQGAGIPAQVVAGAGASGIERQQRANASAAGGTGALDDGVPNSPVDTEEISASAPFDLQRPEAVDQSALRPPMQPVVRPQPRMAVDPLPASNVRVKGPASAKPYYSHDLGRFVFPDDRRGY